MRTETASRLRAARQLLASVEADLAGDPSPAAHHVREALDSVRRADHFTHTTAERDRAKKSRASAPGENAPRPVPGLPRLPPPAGLVPRDGEGGRV